MKELVVIYRETGKRLNMGMFSTSEFWETVQITAGIQKRNIGVKTSKKCFTIIIK